MLSLGLRFQKGLGFECFRVSFRFGSMGIGLGSLDQKGVLGLGYWVNGLVLWLGFGVFGLVVKGFGL